MSKMKHKITEEKKNVHGFAAREKSRKKESPERKWTEFLYAFAFVFGIILVFSVLTSLFPEQVEHYYVMDAKKKNGQTAETFRWVWMEEGLTESETEETELPEQDAQGESASETVNPDQTMPAVSEKMETDSENQENVKDREDEAAGESEIQKEGTEAEIPEETTMEESEDWKEETAATESAEGQSEETAATESAEGQSEETAATESAEGQPEETAATESAEGQSEETAATESAEDQSEETAATESAEDQSEETTATESLDGLPEETAVTESAEGQSEETAATESVGGLPEETAVTESAEGQSEETAATESVGGLPEETAVTESAEGQSEETAATEGAEGQAVETTGMQFLDKMPETVPVSEQTEMIAVTENADGQSEKMTATESMDGQPEETTVPADELSENMAVVEDANGQTEEMTGLQIPDEVRKMMTLDEQLEETDEVESEDGAPGEMAVTESMDESSEETPETDVGDEAAEEVTEKVTEAEQIRRDVDYELAGDKGAWYRDGENLLWVRAGTGLHVSPSGSGRYDTGAEWENLQSDGVLDFTLKQTDEQGNICGESQTVQEAYYVDGEAPEARISAEGNRIGDVIYAPGSCSVSVSVEPDGKSGLKSAAYQIRLCDEAENDNQESQWITCASETGFSIPGEGSFIVYVKTEDQVGNVAFSKSNIIVVDAGAPEIQVTGVTDQSANAGSVSIRVSCRDSFYKSGSLQVQAVGANTGKSPAVRQSGEQKQEAWVEFYDFPQSQNYDDVYEMTVRAEDLAGNIAEKKLSFSINRFGSVYDLASETKELLDGYFISEPDNIVFYEKNIDYVGESEIYCRQNGVLKKLEKGKDYQVSMQGDENTWKQYCYTVSSGCFQQEGVYELLLASGDAASNETDSGLQKKRVTFVLDRTAPSCLITGIESGKVYEEESVIACITPEDNTGLRVLRVYHDSELYLEDTGTPESGETVYIKFEAEQGWQTVQVYLCDMAGNEYWSVELPFFVGGEKDGTEEYQRLRPSAEELTAQRQSISGETQEETAPEYETEIAKDGRVIIRVSRPVAETPETAGADDASAGENTVVSGRSEEMGSDRKTEEKDGNLFAGDGSVSAEGRKNTGMKLLFLGLAVFVFTTGGMLWAVVKGSGKSREELNG